MLNVHPKRPDANVATISANAAHSAFGRPLITNVLRAIVVEAIVDAALPTGWGWCSVDYNSFDFAHDDGTTLEVKQSAAKQSWALAGGSASKCSFDVAARMGRWEGATWIAEPGRNAHIYVLAHHPVTDDTADHRDPQQWRFFVISAEQLPATKRMALSGAQARSEEWTFATLGEGVEKLRLGR